MRRIVLRVTKWTTVVAAAGLSLWLGGGVSFSVQIETIRGLRDVAAIVFGVMGAWIAIVNPQGLSAVFASRPAAAEQVQQVKRLFAPMKIATLVVAYTLVIDIAAPLAAQSQWLVQHNVLARRISYAVMAVSAALLLWSLLLTLVPIDDAERTLEAALETEESRQRRLGRVQKEDVQ